MIRYFVLALMTAVAAFGQYTAKPGGEPPSELAPGIVASLASPGTQILEADGSVYCEIWLVKAAPSGPELSEVDVSWTTVPHGALLGAVRFPEGGKDRRAQQVNPGVYTMRFSFYPIDGAHQGAEPSRDFVLFASAAADKDAAATPDFGTLVALSRRASNTSHPEGLSLWKAESDWKEGLTQMGDDWVLNKKIGDTQVSIIVVGTNPHDK